MIGSIIGGALQVGGSIFGGISAAKAMKKAKGMLEQEKRENQSWYDRRYNEDATQRADAQRILTMTQDSIRDRNRQAAGTQAVMGGTDESVAAAKAANNQALADAASRIAAQGEARKDQIESQYLSNKREINNSLRQMEVDRAREITKAIEGVAGAAGKIGDASDNMFGSSTSSTKAETPKVEVEGEEEKKDAL